MGAKIMDTRSLVHQGLSPKYGKFEVGLMWHHFPTKSWRSRFKKILLLVLRTQSLSLGSILSPKGMSIEGSFGHSSFLDPNPNVNSPSTHPKSISTDATTSSFNTTCYKTIYKGN